MARSPKPLVVRTPAKVNFGLEVQARRTDGYHQIRTVLATIDLWDTLTLTPGGEGIHLECDEPGVPTDETNLVLRAASLLDEAVPGGLPASRGVTIRLAKTVPHGRGLGGGSSDAAATLLALNRILDLGLGRPALHRIAARIGMDTPFFLYGGLALATGRGEQVFPLPDAPELALVLLIPDFAISTQGAYRGLPEPLFSENRKGNGIGRILRSNGSGSEGRCLAPEDFAGRLSECLSNDLEQSAALRETRPPHANLELRRALMAAGAIQAAMTGSGSAVFGVFSDRDAATRAARSLSGKAFRAIATRTISRQEHRSALFAGWSDGAWPRG